MPTILQNIIPAFTILFLSVGSMVYSAWIHRVDGRQR